MTRQPDFSEDSSDPISTAAWFFVLLALALTIRLIWIIYTQYVEEDAFITFRYARQLVAGNGFVYNVGERVYGTTTPLFTLLLAAWIKYISEDVVIGAQVLNLLASGGAIFFTWQTLRSLTKSAAVQLLPLLVLAFSFKLTYMDTQGMEMPVVTLLMAVSWYTWTKGRMIWTGFLAGLLLWTRPDLIFWPAILIILTLPSGIKPAVQLVLAVSLTYLPWFAFSTIYFGSPIPHTITAKWVAYSQFNRSPYLTHFLSFLYYLAPFELSEEFRFLGSVLVWSVMAFAVWHSEIYRDKKILVLFLFIFAELLRITFTRATFFARYFIPVLWCTLILFGIGLGVISDRLKSTRSPRFLFNASVTLIILLAIWTGVRFGGEVQAKQIYRYDSSLKAMGLWLNQNTAPKSTVLLEPLGYVGYYSGRTMVDEVGLVTPAVTKLKEQHVGSDQYPSIFHPDYVVLHCDDAARLQKETNLAVAYFLTRTFDPLGFILGPAPNTLARSSCYQIWQRSQ